MGNAQTHELEVFAPINAPAAVRPRPQRKFETYEHIPFPRFLDVLCAAHIWDQIACHENLQYVFVGSFMARLAGYDFPIHGLEILVDPDALVNYAEKLTDIMHKYPNFLTITSSNRHIIVMRDDRGVVVRFFATGSADYPESFVPPPQSHFRNAQHLGLTSTYRLQE